VVTRSTCSLLPPCSLNSNNHVSKALVSSASRKGTTFEGACGCPDSGRTAGRDRNTAQNRRERLRGRQNGDEARESLLAVDDVQRVRHRWRFNRDRTELEACAGSFRSQSKRLPMG